MLYKEYLSKINRILQEIEKTQAAGIEQAADIIAQAIAAGGLLHVFGCGHSQMYAMEVFYRAGGLVPINAILTPALSLEPKAPLSTHGERIEGLAKVILDNETVGEHDVLLIASTSARNNVPVEMAMEAQRRGMKVIVLISCAFSENVTSRHKSGKKAQDFADVVLDNCGELGDAVMQLPEVDPKFGPTSSVTGFALLQSVIVQTVENLAKRDIKVPIWVSANLDKGDSINQEYIDKYRTIISCL